MSLLLIILKDEAQIQKVVSALLEMEITDATVLDGEGIENLAVRTNPLFAEIGSLFNQDIAYNRTILAHISEQKRVDDLIRLCRRDSLNLADPSVACILIIPCEKYSSTNTKTENE